MIVDLTFDQEYGPRLLAVSVVVVVAVVLFMLGRASGAAYERTAMRLAERFERLRAATREQKRAEYAATREQWLAKAVRAFRVQALAVGLAVCVVVVVAWVAASSFLPATPAVSWGSAAVAVALLWLGAGWMPLRLLRHRQSALEAATALVTPTESE